MSTVPSLLFYCPNGHEFCFICPPWQASFEDIVCPDCSAKPNGWKWGGLTELGLTYKPKPITGSTTDEYWVIKSNVGGKYAIDVVPDVYKGVDYRFLSELNTADQFATFDQATAAVDEIDPSLCPVIQKVRRITSVEVIE